MVLQLAQIVIEPGGCGIFEQSAEAFYGIEFRTSGRRQACVVLAKVEAGLILDDDRQRVRIAFGNLIEKKRVDVLIDRRGE